MKKMLIVDGNSILNRAFYGIKPLTTKDGLYTNAVYGMVTILSRHIEQIKPDFCAVAFDLKAPTFRHKMYDGYKANRKGMPEELAVQLPYAKECMEHMGFRVVTCEGYEADDILGTLSTAVGKQNIQAYVLTGDRDSLQLIDDHVAVLLAKNKETVLFDRDAFFTEYGIPCSSFVDLKALMGDSSDNIPGVPGVGEKTALKLIKEFGSVDGLYASLDGAALTDGMKNKLTLGKESAYLSRTLAEICRSAPISTEAEDYTYSGPHAEELKRLFIQLEFTALIKKFGLESIAVSVENKPIDPERQESTEGPKNAVASTEISKDILFVHCTKEEISVFDGTDLKTFSVNSMEHSALRGLLTGKQIVSGDIKQVHRTLLRLDIAPPAYIFDCMLAAYVLDSGRGAYGLEELFVRYLNYPLPEDVPTVKCLPALYLHLKDAIEEKGFGALLYDIELPLAPILAEMELRGFKIDCEGIATYGIELEGLAEALRERIYSYAGEEFNIGSPKQLGEILFEKMCLPKSRKTKTGYSTDAETLQKLRGRHPIIEDILDYRQVTKLKSTYTDALIGAADEYSRVHSVLNQTGTATGRLSSSEPNLQNIPVKTELGRRFRGYFIPSDDDHVLIDADYSQIELRLLAHVSDDETLIGAFLSGEDIHTTTAAKVFGVPVDAVTPEMRKNAKAVNFGIMYGIGEYSLSEDLGISRARAKEYIDSYFAKFPKVRAYLDRVQEEARRDGFVTTFFGRRRYIPELSSSNKNLQHFGERVAMNSPIQGTAADIIKIAMIRVQERLRAEGLAASLIMQVHDELILESEKVCAEQVMKILTDSMEHAAELSVPLSVEAHVGESWLDAK